MVSSIFRSFTPPFGLSDEAVSRILGYLSGEMNASSFIYHISASLVCLFKPASQAALRL